MNLQDAIKPTGFVFLFFDSGCRAAQGYEEIKSHAGDVTSQTSGGPPARIRKWDHLLPEFPGRRSLSPSASFYNCGNTEAA